MQNLKIKIKSDSVKCKNVLIGGDYSKILSFWIVILHFDIYILNLF